MNGFLKRFFRYIAIGTGRGHSMYKRFGAPDAFEWASCLARWERIDFVGADVRIGPGCNITEPALVRIGNNVTLSDCALLGRDGLIHILSTRFNKKLDSVGAIDIRDNYFIGCGAIVMPRVTSTPDSIVAAGAVVTKDVPPGVVVGGNPARIICAIEELLSKVEARCNAYPWIDIIRRRSGACDSDLESMLTAVRVKHFFGGQANG